MRKRRQHFVWQHYLKPWTAEGQIACLRGGKIFRTSTVNVAVERDFYRLQEMSEDDIKFVRHFIERSMQEARGLHEGWLRVFTSLFTLRRAYEASGRTDKALELEIDKTLTNLEEDLHGRYERNAQPMLESLQNRDTAFFGDSQGFITFMIFLTVQYFRTRRIHNRIAGALAEFPLFDASRTVGVLRHVFATNVSGTIVGSREHWWIALLHAPEGAEFITGDQPVLNTHAIGLEGEPQRLEFYYPVTAATAVLIGDSRDKAAPTDRIASAAAVARYNGYIAGVAEEQLYAKSEEALRPFQR